MNLVIQVNLMILVTMLILVNPVNYVIAVHLVILVNPLNQVILVLTQPQVLAKERKYLHGPKYILKRLQVLEQPQVHTCSVTST